MIFLSQISKISSLIYDIISNNKNIVFFSKIESILDNCISHLTLLNDSLSYYKNNSVINNITEEKKETYLNEGKITNPICDLNNVSNIIENEGLDLMIVSYGGCCSNTLTDILEENGYKIRTPTYCDILCHCPEFIKVSIPVIYIYDNPKKALLSMKNRNEGFWDVNQRKLSNNKNVELSDEMLLKLMINQFNSWTSSKYNNILIIKSSELFELSIKDKLEGFLNKKLNGFPVEYKEPKTKIDEIDDIELFKKYESELDKIINFIPNN